MPSLKEYRNRIVSVKSTRKITSAMKMVAASKLKRAQERAQASQPYARAMNAMLARVAAGIVQSPALPKLLVGTGSDRRHLLVVITADRGLCGGFNGNLLRFARIQARELTAQGKDVKILTIGRKARDLLKRDQADRIVKSFVELGGARSQVGFSDADNIADYILEQFRQGAFDVCTLVYNEFKNVLTQKPKAQQLIPFTLPKNAEAVNDNGVYAPYSFEPEEEALLAELMPKNIAVQIFTALLDSAAGEQAARMTAMENATKNAGDMIKKVSLQYNRARQAYITKELIEIISGAEAV